MILNSRKRRQIRQQQRAGQETVREIGREILGLGIDQQIAGEQLTRFLALGSTKGSWWADVGFMRHLKGQMNKVK